MELKDIMCLIGGGTLIGYCIYLYKKFGVLRSISASIDYIKFKPLFTFVMFIVGLSLSIAAMEIKPNALGFFAGALIAGVGAAPLVSYSMLEEKVHVFCATVGILLGMIYMATFGWIETGITGLFALFTYYCVESNNYRKYKGQVKKVKVKWLGPRTNSMLTKLSTGYKTFWSKMKRVKNHTWWIEIVAATTIITYFLTK